MRCVGDDAYKQDLIAPARVEHRVELGDRHNDTEFGYHYNYLAYEFLEGEAVVEALHYLDESDVAHVRVIEPPDLSSVFVLRVLIFLTMRFERLTFNKVVRQSPLLGPLLEQVKAARKQHMEAVAE